MVREVPMQFHAIKSRLESCIAQIQTIIEKTDSKKLSQHLEDELLRLRIWSSDSGLHTVEPSSQTDSRIWKFAFELLGLWEVRFELLDAISSTPEKFRKPGTEQSEISDASETSGDEDEEPDQDVHLLLDCVNRNIKSLMRLSRDCRSDIPSPEQDAFLARIQAVAPWDHHETNWDLEFGNTRQLHGLRMRRVA
ncbi:hypothetical protein K469DRAFT_697733 [Zopfia rhizophila CBS 207.26]|uniref:Uncharacterized protein n=1 Tax=Zopfia rhizophila CBS 207.26 TaxID=1314779 RepID=A0A6A6EFH1_9PEZI|nr:hypothetical protein K469DRAFT_697733 [Zopfia rhizophila CBS 207.26]